MKKISFLAIIFALAALSLKLFSSYDDKPLPNWIDPTREVSDNKPPVLYTRATLPPDFRIPAEYEPVQAVVIGWMGYYDMLTEIAKATTTLANAKIWSVEGPYSIPGVSSDLYSQVDCPLDTVWMRDYGPFGLSSLKNEIGIVDTIYRHYSYRRDDDALPTCLGRQKGVDTFGANLILDGGNFMIDSAGNLFMTKRTYTWNNNKTKQEVDRILMENFRIKNIYALDYAGYPNSPADGTGHIDMFAKLLNDFTVLISIADTEPYKSNALKAISFFENLTAPDGGNYKIIKVKGWEKSRTWYTYTNSLIVNNVVLMPSYSGYKELEDLAINAYKEGIEGVFVKPINSDSSIYSGGSIHCVTQTIPAI